MLNCCLLKVQNVSAVHLYKKIMAEQSKEGNTWYLKYLTKVIKGQNIWISFFNFS